MEILRETYKVKCIKYNSEEKQTVIRREKHNFQNKIFGMIRG